MKEANTVKEKNISIRLSETDCDKLSKLCGENGLTVSSLIEAFVGDLTDGTYSNGSDEQYAARQWFDRCGFAMMSEDTLLKYFLRNDHIYDTDYFLEIMDEIKSIEATLKEYETNPEMFDREKIELEKNDLEACREDYDKIYKEFVEEFKKKHPAADIEKEIQAMREWQEESLDLRLEDAGEERNKREEMARKRISVYKTNQKGIISECIGEFYNEELLRDFLKYHNEERNLILVKNGKKIEMIKPENPPISVSMREENYIDEQIKHIIVDYYSTNDRYIYNRKYSVPMQDVYTKENDKNRWLTLEQISTTQIEVRQTNSNGHITARDLFELTGNIPKLLSSERILITERYKEVNFNEDDINVICQYGGSSKEETCRNISDMLLTIKDKAAMNMAGATMGKLNLLPAESCEGLIAVIKRWKNREEADNPTLNSSIANDSDYSVMDARRKRKGR